VNIISKFDNVDALGDITTFTALKLSLSVNSG